MYITKITSQHRRDIRMRLKCGSCGNEEHNISGYDDAHFHSEEVPKMKCIKCGKNAKDNDNEVRIMCPKYQAWEAV